MVLQAFVDESYQEHSGVFVMAGYIAPESKWRDFSRDWEAELPWGTRAKAGHMRFKMSEMTGTHLDRVERFYRVIERHRLIALSLQFNIHELAAARDRIWTPSTHQPIPWGDALNPYRVGFHCLMDMFHLRRDETSQLINADEPIDFIFDDEQKEKSAIVAEWSSYLADFPPSVRARFGKVPKFERDEDFLGLQAADFWAWWMRRWQQQGETAVRMADIDFGLWRGDPSAPRIVMRYTEDNFVATFLKVLQRQHPLLVFLDRRSTVAPQTTTGAL